MMTRSVWLFWKSVDRKSAPSDGHVADPRKLVDALRILRLEQARDGEALSVPQFDRRMRLALGQ